MRRSVLKILTQIFSFFIYKFCETILTNFFFINFCHGWIIVQIHFSKEKQYENGFEVINLF